MRLLEDFDHKCHETISEMVSLSEAGNKPVLTVVIGQTSFQVPNQEAIGCKSMEFRFQILHSLYDVETYRLRILAKRAKRYPDDDIEKVLPNANEKRWKQCQKLHHTEFEKQPNSYSPFELTGCLLSLERASLQV
jgi:hypothetical protein